MTDLEAIKEIETSVDAMMLALGYNRKPTMEKTIEEKLSAIKAINEEKESVEHAIDMLSQSSCIIVIQTEEEKQVITLPAANSAIVRNLVVRQKELIEHATELMK